MSDQFCLKWNNHHTTLVAVFDKLFECESLVDCTVAAEGKFVKAHKVVLSACSSYLEELLLNHDDKHPILIFNDISYVELKAMLEYMYRGEVNVSQDQLNTFLKAAEALRIKGLTTDQGGGDGGGGGSGGAAGSAELNDLRKKLPRKEARTNSPVLGTTPVERPSSPKRKRRMSSRDENYANDSNSCDTAPTPPPASGHNAVTKTEEKLGRLKRDGGSGADTPGLPPVQTSTPHHKLLQPKTEFIEEPSNTEDDMAVLEDEEDYGPNPGTSQASFSSQDFNNWQLGDGTGDEVFMGGQHDLNNTAGNSQVSNEEEVVRSLRAIDCLQIFEGGEEGEDMASQHYCLRWNNYQSNMTSVFHHLLRTQSFVDVTLACNDQSLKAHKVVLSACSSYFQKLLLENPCKHPTIIMPQDVCFTDLKFIIEFVYKGEIDVSQAQLQSLLKTADQLKIKGLCEVPEGKSGAEVTPLSPTPIRKSGLSVKKRRLASVKRRLLYRERLMQQTGVHQAADANSHAILKKEVESNCINVSTGTEVVKDLPVVVVNQNATGINDAIMIASPQSLQTLQPATPHLRTSPVPSVQVANEVNQATQVEVEMAVEPPAPSATLVSTTTMDIQTSEPTTTHRDIAIDSSDLEVEENGVKVKFETLRSIDRVDHMELETNMTNGAVQTNVEDDPSMHTMMITPELLGLIPSSNSESGDMDQGKVSLGGMTTMGTLPAGGKAWTKEDMEAALDALRKQTMSLSKASAHYGIPSTTLWQRAHRLGIDTPKKDGPAKSWTEDNLNTALDALRQGSISANKASKAFGIPSSTLYKIARREGIRLAAPFNAAPTSWVPEDLERALEAIRSGQFTVQRAATEYGIPSGTLYGRCKREGIELSRNNPTPWSEDAMMEALEAVRVGQMSINQAAIHYNLPYSSLYGRFKRVKYEAEGLSGSETETSEQHGPVQQTTPTHPSPSAHPAPAHPPQTHASQAHAPPPTQSQPQIMLVQYQQPLHMYQSAT